MTNTRTSLRPSSPADADFLRNLFTTDKAEEFAAQGLPESLYQPLIDMQYRSRAATYSAQHPDAESWIISMLCHPERSEGSASVLVGHYLLDKTPLGLRLVDLAVLPQHRNKGIATQALLQIQQQAAAEGTSLHLRVEKQNPALRFYARLGFKDIGEDEISFEMIWQ